MNQLCFIDNQYATTPRKLSLVARYLPSLHFYTRFISIVFRCSAMARRGEYGAAEWSDSSGEVLGYLEDIGVRVQISGIEHVREIEGPCVIIGNHMSFIETLLLPVIVLPFRPMTFVVKQSLLEYPVFKHVMRSCDPVAISRTNPRQDLKVVLEEGEKRLSNGISVIVFPQSTRSHSFDPKQMSSIGVKLAKKAQVPIVPLALKTDALQNGKYIKDFGEIDRTIPVQFAFGEPFHVTGKGAEEQERITAFIGRKLQQWQVEDLSTPQK